MLDTTPKSHKTGKIVVFAGPMFAGKTTQLLEIAEQLARVNRKYIAYKPVIDTRYSDSEISTHKQSRLNSSCIQSAADIDTDIENILIDEAQFLDREAGNSVRDLAQKGHNIYVAGLNMDSFGKPFGPMPELMAIADTVVHLRTICQICGVYDAQYTYRKNTDSNQQTVVGGADFFEPRCKDCWSS